jgi:HAD superfamily hydrolase (TIGR01509 family)
MRSVIFDCDGVLVDSERLAHQVKVECLEQLGLRLSVDEAMRLFMGKDFKAALGILKGLLGRPVPEAWIYDYAFALANAFIGELKAIPGVRSVLNSLVDRKVKICVASQSTLPRIRCALHAVELDGFFQNYICTAAMVEKPKPAPDIFLAAARMMNVLPEACLVIEDSPSGVLGAREAGMVVLGYAATQSASALEEAGAIVFNDMYWLNEHLDQFLEC